MLSGVMPNGERDSRPPDFKPRPSQLFVPLGIPIPFLFHHTHLWLREHARQNCEIDYSFGQTWDSAPTLLAFSTYDASIVATPDAPPIWRFWIITATGDADLGRRPSSLNRFGRLDPFSKYFRSSSTHVAD